MNDSRTVGKRYIIITGYIECFLMLAFDSIRRTLIERLVFLIFQLFTHISLKHFIGCLPVFCQRRQHRIKKRLRHIISIAVYTPYLRICLLRVDTET